MKGRIRRTQPRWMLTLKVGDVIAERSGAWRVVRDVKRAANGDLHYLTLAIRHCSWTHRCYTCLYIGDIWTRQFRKVHVKTRPLRTRLDKQIAAAIVQPCNERYVLTCCDVEGVA